MIIAMVFGVGERKRKAKKSKSGDSAAARRSKGVARRECVVRAGRSEVVRV